MLSEDAVRVATEFNRILNELGAYERDAEREEFLEHAFDGHCRKCGCTGAGWCCHESTESDWSTESD